MNRKRPAIFPPGDYIREELEARGWTQTQFARILGRTQAVISQIINGKKRITEETAKQTGAVLGTGPEVWVNMEAAYRLHHAPEPDPSIARRARRLEAASR